MADVKKVIEIIDKIIADVDEQKLFLMLVVLPVLYTEQHL